MEQPPHIRIATTLARRAHHLVAWLVWHSSRVSLLADLGESADDGRDAAAGAQAGQDPQYS